MTNKDGLIRLSHETIRSVEELGYAIGSGLKTHSSTFYNLTKANKEYLLKLDQTHSGSLLHQHVYSDVQKRANVLYMPVAELNNENQYLILEKIEGFSNMGDVLNQEFAKYWGNTMLAIHKQGDIDSYSIWVEEYREFMSVNFEDSIEMYLVLAEERFAGLSYEQESKAREIIVFIRNNIERYSQSPVQVHGDPHINNTMVYNGKPLIYDPNGTVLYGSPYLDLAIIAIDFPGYFIDGISNSVDDKNYMKSFLQGYGEIDIESLYYYILLRGVERYSFSSFITNVDVLTDYIYSLLSKAK